MTETPTPSYKCWIPDETDDKGEGESTLVLRPRYGAHFDGEDAAHAFISQRIADDSELAREATHKPIVVRVRAPEGSVTDYHVGVEWEPRTTTIRQAAVSPPACAYTDEDGYHVDPGGKSVGLDETRFEQLGDTTYRCRACDETIHAE